MADTLITGTTLVEKESRSIGDSPIGAIIAWAKNLSGVPNLAEGWVECDGQVLSDALSSLNGVTIPDLNGDNRFLRGNSTSGGTGGSSSHTHALDGATVTNIGITGSGMDVINMNDGQFTDSKSTLPIYYEVVWIMRVR